LVELAGELSQTHGITATVIDADLAEPDAARRIHEEVERRGLAVDYLVNNAGFGGTGAFADTEEGRDARMVQVNVTALVELTHQFLPAMVQRGRGRVLNI